MYETKIIFTFVSIFTFGGDILFRRPRFPVFRRTYFLRCEINKQPPGYNKVFPKRRQIFQHALVS